jgi:hypothetical protein
VTWLSLPTCNNAELSGPFAVTVFRMPKIAAASLFGPLADTTLSSPYIPALLFGPFAEIEFRFPLPPALLLEPLAVIELSSPVSTLAWLWSPIAITELPLPNTALAKLWSPIALATFGFAVVDAVVSHCAVPLCSMSTPLIDKHLLAPAAPAGNARAVTDNKVAHPRVVASVATRAVHDRNMIPTFNPVCVCLLMRRIPGPFRGPHFVMRHR